MNIKIRNLLLIWGAAFFLLFSAFEGFAAQTKHRPTKHPREKHRSYGAPEKHPRPLHPKKKYMISPPAVRPKAPGSSHVWVPRYRHPSGVYVGGYWRPPSRASFIWIEGYWNEGGAWVFGYWKPLKVKPGYVWVPGYWGNTVWVNGYWRPAKKPNHIWVPGHYNNRGVWIKGHWK